MKLWFLTIVVFFFAAIEILLGNLGIVIPLTLIPVFFAVAEYGQRAGMVCAIAAGVLLDVTYDRDFPLSVAAFSAMVICTWYFLHDRGIREMPDSIPAILTGALSAEAIWNIGAFLLTDATQITCGEMLAMILWNGFFASLCIFGGYFLLNHLSAKLGLEMRRQLTAAEDDGENHRKRRWNPSITMK